MAMRDESAEPMPRAITLEELMRQQQSDPFFTRVRSRLEKGEEIAFENNLETGAIERMFAVHRCIVVPKSPQARLIRLDHYPVAAGLWADGS